MTSGTVIRFVAIVVSAVFVAGTWLVDGSANFGFLRFFSIAVLITSVIATAWDRWLWKLPPMQHLPKVTRNLSGTWETWLESSWVDPVTGEPIAPKTVYVVIRQTSSAASVTLLSNESRSKSSLARVVEEDSGWLLHYLYSNEPDIKLRERSPIHHGSGVLNVVGNPAKRLNGSYWTDRDSKGKLTLNRRVSKHADDFQEAQELLVEAGSGAR